MRYYVAPLKKCSRPCQAASLDFQRVRDAAVERGNKDQALREPLMPTGGPAANSQGDDLSVLPSLITLRHNGYLCC